jgi:hypothetical protein
MQALRRFFSLFKAKEAPPTLDDDEVYPLFFLDNLSTGRVIVLSETLRFDAVLDPIKLRDGLTRLIQHGDWRKLGGRLRARVSKSRLFFLVATFPRLTVGCFSEGRRDP